MADPKKALKPETFSCNLKSNDIRWKNTTPHISHTFFSNTWSKFTVSPMFLQVL